MPALAAIQFQPANPTVNDEVFGITSASGGYTNVDLRWSGPSSGSAGCAPGRPCGERKSGQFFWHHRMGKLPAGTYSVVFKSDQCNPCDTATLIVSPPCQPQQETCNDKDDDCNGQIDDGVERECYSGPAGTKGQGPCKAGKQICIAGKWAQCNGETVPTQELCNDKIDNDCNGQVDEICECNDGETRECYSGPAATKGQGICKAGTQTCQNRVWMACEGEVLPGSKDICGDGKDDDCNGQIDDGCGGCTDGATQPCYSGDEQTANVGTCKPGQQTCQGGAWSPCQGEITPVQELCSDQLDNDCDGQINNGCSGTDAPTPSESASERISLELPVPDAGAGLPSCPNGIIVDNCDSTGACKKVCRVARRSGCSCDSGAVWPPWLYASLLLLFLLLPAPRRSRQMAHTTTSQDRDDAR